MFGKDVFFSTIDLFHNKLKGLFTIFNDECTLLKPSIENFKSSLKEAWQKSQTSPISWDIRKQKTNGNMFLIRHFTNDVVYSMVNQFILHNFFLLNDDNITNNIHTYIVEKNLLATVFCLYFHRLKLISQSDFCFYIRNM